MCKKCVESCKAEKIDINNLLAAIKDLDSKPANHVRKEMTRAIEDIDEYLVEMEIGDMLGHEDDGD